MTPRPRSRTEWTGLVEAALALADCDSDSDAEWLRCVERLRYWAIEYVLSRLGAGAPGLRERVEAALKQGSASAP